MKKVTVTVQLTTPDDFDDDDATMLVTQALEESQPTLDAHNVAVDGAWVEEPELEEVERWDGQG